MERARLAAREPELTGLTILIVGLGRSGLAAARLALARGARVVASDAKSEAQLGPAASEARRMGLELQLGSQPAELADGADLVVLSPGVPPHLPLVARARERGLPVWGEIELAARYCHGRVIAITGSNGKSTVTSMTGAILRVAGFPGGTGGNLGLPLADLLAQDSVAAIHAVELSSFQLETLESLHADVAVLLNLSPDHLDRYACYTDYAAAKQRLFQLQQPDKAAVLNADDADSQRFLPSVRARLFRFSTAVEVEHGAFLRDGRLVLRTERREETLLAEAELPVPGQHNVANALAAALAARLIGCPPEAITEGLRGYRALPHRLEAIAKIRDVAFFNDSKATNPASTARALASFSPGTVQLILGGKDKGLDWAPLLPLVRAQARRVLLVGQAASLLRDVLGDAAPVVDCGTVERAVTEGLAGARRGDTVLLSPGCASFDQYRNFEERGEDFRRVVLALAGEGSRDA